MDRDDLAPADDQRARKLAVPRRAELLRVFKHEVDEFVGSRELPLELAVAELDEDDLTLRTGEKRPGGLGQETSTPERMQVAQ